MGSGYSVIDGNVEISKERMQKIYAAYCDPYAYSAWKKQLEYSAKKQQIHCKTKNMYTENIFMLNPENT
jgi:hypothetical protein